MNLGLMSLRFVTLAHAHYRIQKTKVFLLGSLGGFWLFLSSLECRAGEPSIARVWNEELLEAIRLDLPNPPVHARNLFSLSVAMYDAWAAYEPTAHGYIYTNKHTSSTVGAARRAAISHAAYRLLRSRFNVSIRQAITLPALNSRMVKLGYDLNGTSEDPSTPDGLGRLIFRRVHEHFINDGAREAQEYKDFSPEDGGYKSLNGLPLLIGVPNTLATFISRWQPLAITDAVTQNGISADSIQRFQGAHWWDVQAFALTRNLPHGMWIDPGPPPQLEGQSAELFRSNIVEVIRASSQLSPDDGVTLDISPSVFGNNSLGSNDGKGHSLNPVTGQPYPPNVVKRGDFTRVLAEYWADGPNSETPPGHWNVFANQLRDHPDFRPRFQGLGPEFDPLHWDVKMYFALNAALHDAACAAWTLKRQYDGWRPMTAVRFMAAMGQSSDSSFTSNFSKYGLPLTPDLIEWTTAETVKAAARHEGLPAGLIALRVWPRQPTNITQAYSGVKWIRGDFWWPYQAGNFVTPAFPGYISGHSTFSRAAAEVLTALTGSEFFPGGKATRTFAANAFLRTELGPTESIALEWATYYDAADQAGASRILGGIHASCDDLPGRIAGAECGRKAWAKALVYFGPQPEEPVPVRTSLERRNDQLVFTVEASAGSYFHLQRSLTIKGPFTNLSPDSVTGSGPTLSITQPLDGDAGYFRVMRSLNP